MRFFRTKSLFLFQIAGALSAFAVFGLWPPVAGQMLLVPIDGSGRNDLAKAAIAGGAALLQAGRLPQSMVVRGNRADVAAQLRGRTILILAASGATCGRGGRDA